MGADLDLQVAGRELDRAAVLAQQHVGQDGQRVPAFHDAGHRLQRFKQIGLGSLENDHCCLPLYRCGGSW
jgi:hypothetical protein